MIFLIKLCVIIITVVINSFGHTLCSALGSSESKQFYQDFTVCENCYDFAELMDHVITDLFVDIYIADSCDLLCSQIVDHYNSSLSFEITCNLVCDLFGIVELKTMTQNIIDLGSILFCEELKFCEINDYGDAKIYNYSISPSIAPQGFFVFNFDYITLNGTGTGQIGIDIITVDNIPFELTYLNLPKTPG